MVHLDSVTKETDSMLLNKIICGDAVEVMRSLPDESIDLVVTSPPYNLKNSTGNGMNSPNNSFWKDASLMRGYDNYDDNLPYEEYIAWQRDCLTEMMRLIPDDGAIFYNHKWRVQGGLLQDRKEIVDGFPVRQIIIWYRKGGINFNPGYFLPTYEVIYLIAKPKFKLAKGANKLTDVWEISPERNNPHPAPFPEELARRCIGSTNAATILDPFVGSGTVPVVAIELGRQYIGIDKSPVYCEMAKERIKRALLIRKNDGCQTVSSRVTK